MFNVLIADKDVDAWFGVNALLRRYLIKASFVQNLNAAREYIDNHCPTLLFLDKQLQENNLKDLMLYVRSKYPQAKIVFINACGDRIKSIASSADLIINKPLLPDTVERALQKLLQPQENAAVYAH
ncbi:MAG TPA: hypothetical protein VL307_16950 [Chitinophagaceae bacterium]|nr:hypothetical protein [Chitinophagaceae bacterium]